MYFFYRVNLKNGYGLAAESFTLTTEILILIKTRHYVTHTVHSNKWIQSNGGCSKSDA